MSMGKNSTIIRVAAFLFFISLLSGQLVRIPILPGVTVYPHDILLVFFLVTWVFCQKKNWKTIWKFPLTKPLLVFIAICTASLFFGIGRYPMPELLAGSGYLVRILLYMGLYVISATTLTPGFWLVGFYSVGATLCVFGLLQFFLYPDLRNLMYLGWDPHYWRLFSTLLDPNFMGIVAVLTFLVGFAVFAGKKKLLPLPFFFQVLVFVAACLTFSRSALAAGLGAVVAYVPLTRRWQILLIALCIVFGIWLMPKPGGGTSDLLRQETAYTRLENWEYSKDIILKAPFSGYGFNMLRSIQTPDWSAEGAELSHATAGVDNSFLFVAATTGIIGLASFLFLLYSMGRMGVRLMKQKRTAVFGYVYFLSLVAVCVDSLFINSFFYPWVFLWVMMLSGVGEKLSTT